jgi:hypothetical protein
MGPQLYMQEKMLEEYYEETGLIACVVGIGPGGQYSPSWYVPTTNTNVVPTSRSWAGH